MKNLTEIENKLSVEENEAISKDLLDKNIKDMSSSDLEVFISEISEMDEDRKNVYLYKIINLHTELSLHDNCEEIIYCDNVKAIVKCFRKELTELFL